MTDQDLQHTHAQPKESFGFHRHRQGRHDLNKVEMELEKDVKRRASKWFGANPRGEWNAGGQKVSEDFTPELVDAVKRHAKDSTIILTTVDSNYKESFLKWAAIMAQFDMEKHVIAMTLDDEMQEFLQNHGIASRRLHVSKGLMGLWKARIQLVRFLLTQAKMNVLLTDVDALWRRPGVLEYLNKQPGDIVASRGGGSPPRRLTDKWGSIVCMGFVLFRPSLSNATLKLLEKETDQIGDDQVGINEMLDKSEVQWEGGRLLDREESNKNDFGTFNVAGTNSTEKGTITLLAHNLVVRMCPDVKQDDDVAYVMHCNERQLGTPAIRKLSRRVLTPDWETVPYDGDTHTWLKDISSPPNVTAEDLKLVNAHLLRKPRGESRDHPLFGSVTKAELKAHGYRDESQLEAAWSAIEHGAESDPKDDAELGRAIQASSQAPSRMLRSPESDGKRCGNSSSDMNRVFSLTAVNATLRACEAACVADSLCRAFSVIENAWCIGCKTPLSAPLHGASSYTKQKKNNERKLRLRPRSLPKKKVLKSVHKEKTKEKKEMAKVHKVKRVAKGGSLAD